MNNMKESLIFRILEFGMNNRYFRPNKIFAAIGEELSDQYFNAVSRTETKVDQNTIFYQFSVIRDIENNNRFLRYGRIGEDLIRGETHSEIVYQITPNAAATFVEMLELHEARQSAIQAKKLALISIGISIFLAMVAILVQVLTVQEVKVVNDTTKSIEIPIGKVDKSPTELESPAVKVPQDTIKPASEGLKKSKYKRP